jgi:hypothetical protein
MKSLRLSLFLTLFLASAICAYSETAAKLLPFQGRLTDQNGLAVTNGVRLVQFKIYEVPTAGSPVWAGELHRTTVNGGLVNVMLGSKTPFTGFDFDRQLYLEITLDLNGDNTITAADPPMLPRQAILPVIFAKEAADSRLLDGYDWNALFGTNSPASGTLLDSKIRDGSINARKLQPGTITSNQIAPQTINASLIAPGAVTNAASIGVNGLQAFTQPTPNALVPLDAASKFPASTIPFAAAIGVSGYFKSPEVAVAVSDVSSTTHGLGGQPVFFMVTLICKTAELGYAVGDEVLMPSYAVGGVVGNTVFANSTTVGQKSGASIYISDKTPSNTADKAITPANWRFIFRAWR